MKDCKKYSKATICRHMKRKIDDSVVDNRKNNEGRPENFRFNARVSMDRRAEAAAFTYMYTRSSSQPLTIKRSEIF